MRGSSRVAARCLVILAVLAGCLSCKLVDNVLHDGKVVAKVGDHKLYSDELRAYIPDGLSEADSVRLALQYINSWASDLLFLDIAEKELNKEEKDVSGELEEYRRSLLKFRYEQKYVNQRLDTTITKSQIEKYYNDHPGNWILDVPIVKARFLNISPESPLLPTIRRKMSSEDVRDLVEADSLAYHSAQKYTVYSDKWIGMNTLARDFEGENYLSLYSSMKNRFIERTDSRGNVSIVYISDILREGESGPVEYFEERIRDIILSTRKQALLTGLERDLLEKARNQENLVLY